jgi:hypothetical protein
MIALLSKRGLFRKFGEGGLRNKKCKEKKKDEEKHCAQIHVEIHRSM